MDESLYWKFHEVEEKHWWFRARRRIVLHLIEEVVHLSATARILDIGCGTGGTLKFFQERYDAWGIDASELAVRLSRQRGVKNVVHGDLQSFTRTNEPFDLVTLLDVIEHIDDDVGFLRQSVRAIKPGGWALVTVPALPWLWSAHDDVNHHKRRYERAELSSRLVSAGLRPVYISYFNSFLFPLALLERMTSGLRKKQASAGLDLPSPFVNRWLERIFVSEGMFLGSVRFPIGLSLIALAKRPE
jgi:SAM-dependent methyltransferase